MGLARFQWALGFGLNKNVGSLRIGLKGVNSYFLDLGLKRRIELTLVYE